MAEKINEWKPSNDDEDLGFDASDLGQAIQQAINEARDMGEPFPGVFVGRNDEAANTIATVSLIKNDADAIEIIINLNRD